MSAPAFQAALARAVIDAGFARAVAAGAYAPGLTPRERRRLAAAAGHPGLALTRELHCGWRLGKVLTLLPLTARLLGDRLAGELIAFWKERPPRSLFFQEDALAFAARLADRPCDDPYVAEVAGYERARLELVHPNPAEPPPRVREVRFLHDAEIVMSRLAEGELLEGVPERPSIVRGTWDGDGDPVWTVHAHGED